MPTSNLEPSVKAANHSSAVKCTLNNNNNNVNNNNLGFISITMEHPIFHKRNSLAFLDKEIAYTLTHGTTYYNQKLLFMHNIISRYSLFDNLK